MASIYAKTVIDQQLILSPREYMQRQFDFGSAWNEIRMGAFVSAVTSGGDNTNPTAQEIVTVSSFLDYATFGIKNSDNNLMPGQAGAGFLGMISYRASTDETTLQTVVQTGDFFRISNKSDATSCSLNGFKDTTIKGSVTTHGQWPLATNPAATTGYNAFIGLKFALSNRGTSSQSVAISSAATGAVSGTDYSSGALRTALNTFSSPTGPDTIPWNDGASAYALPDSAWIRLPFFNNRLRISALYLEVIS